MKNPDVILLVPFDDGEGFALEPGARQSFGAHLLGPLRLALSEFEEYCGLRFNLASKANSPRFNGEPLSSGSHRSLTAVTLATHLERAGLNWMVVDPGIDNLAGWRRRLAKLRGSDPIAVGISTTFTMGSRWIRILISLVRRTFPRAKLILGGYYYATDARDFLSLDADVFCVGEGEVRLPEIVHRLKSGETLDAVPGLYIPNADGSLRHTGRAEPLDMAKLPAIDWSLSSRIEPSLDIHSEKVDVGVETQRGCVFKCGFCTFRTLASPTVMSPEAAVERIFNTASVRAGAIMMTDATASYPHDRWVEILKLLIDRGGAPHPIWAYVRVSDLPDETVRLMSLAGVKHVFIGQESGDQEMLNRMRKGTNLRQIQPAIDALARHNITAITAFIHGYPGETSESLNNTRALLASINDGHEAKPPVLLYVVHPFILQDMTSVAQDEDVDLISYYLNYPPKRSAEECLATVIACSRIPHAPAFLYLLGKEKSTSSSMIAGGHSTPHEVFRWMKTVERGMGIFLEKNLDGTRVNGAELNHLKRTLLESYYQHRAGLSQVAPSLARTAVGAASASLYRRLNKEWRNEEQDGPGAFTRVLVGLTAYKQLGNVKALAEGLRTGRLSTPESESVKKAASGSIGEAADQIIEQGMQNGKMKLMMYNSDGKLERVKTRKSLSRRLPVRS